MKRLTKYLPLYTLTAGIICGILRTALFAGLDGKGLIPTDHPANLPMTLLVLLSALLLILGWLWQDRRDFRICVNFPVPAFGCIAGGAGLLLGYISSPEKTPFFTLIYLLGAACFLLTGFFRWKAKKPPLAFLAGINIAFLALCFSQYRQWGTYTQLQGYLFPALSALFLVLYSLQYLLLELPERCCKKAFVYGQAALLSSLACLSTPNWPYYLCLSLWLVSGFFCTPYAMKLPRNVKKAMAKLEKAGFTVYAVGGCVRDAMLGLTPHDYDLCTNARPEDICRVFDSYQLIRSGEKHGTIGVVIGKQVYEITTYRTEGSYADNRHPDSVTFVDRIEEDLARRDFTVNAMAFHPNTGYVDPFGGQKDLFAGVLRTVGQPEDRFREDALRILRGVRFACRFHLEPETKTEKAMAELSPLLDNLAMERIYSELTQTLCAMEKNDLLRFSPVLLQVLPELNAAVGFNQHTRHHIHDVFTHTAAVLEKVDADPILRWAALLHDAGKPQVFTQDEKGQGHFYGHAKISAEMADDILLRLKAPNALREQVVFLIAHHMDDTPAEKSLLRRKLSRYGQEYLTNLIRLQYADRIGTGKATAAAEKLYTKSLQIVEQLQSEEGRLQIRDLAVDGHDLMALGFAPGPQLGECQKYLLEQVLDGALPNEKEPLLQAAQTYLNQ